MSDEQNKDPLEQVADMFKALRYEIQNNGKRNVCGQHAELVALCRDHSDVLEAVQHDVRASTGKLSAIGDDIRKAAEIAAVANQQAAEAQQQVAVHLATHNGMDKAKAEVTGEHDRREGRKGNVIGWVFGGLGLLFTIVAAVWFLAQQVSAPQPQIDTKELAHAIKAALKEP